MSLQRNQVNVESLDSVSHDIQEAIDKKAEHMFTMKELENSINENRLIPPFDAQTMDVSKIYKLENSKLCGCSTMVRFPHSLVVITEEELALLYQMAWTTIELKEWTEVRRTTR